MNPNQLASPVVEFKDVRFSYPEVSRRRGRPFAIHDLSFTVESGEILGVLGPNASGKTTLLRLLSKLLIPAAGEIRLEGQPLGRVPRTVVATRVAVVPQDIPREFPYTVEELVVMGRFPHSPRRFFESEADWQMAREAMALTGVLELGSEPLERLSGGERQRVVLARALAQQPRLLVLDEPTAHLDLRHQADCIGLLRRLNRQSGLTVILVSHDLNLASEVCHRLLLLDKGRAVRLGPPESVLDAAVLEAVYGCRIEVAKHPETGRPAVAVAWPEREGMASLADGQRGTDER